MIDYVRLLKLAVMALVITIIARWCRAVPARASVVPGPADTTNFKAAALALLVIALWGVVRLIRRHHRRQRRDSDAG